MHADTAPEIRVDGVVAQDGGEAVFSLTLMARPAAWPPPRLRLPGLDPDRRYRVTELAPGAPVPAGQRPPWLDAGVVATGRVLHVHGIEAPSLDPDRTALFHVVEA